MCERLDVFLYVKGVLLEAVRPGLEALEATHNLGSSCATLQCSFAAIGWALS